MSPLRLLVALSCVLLGGILRANPVVIPASVMTAENVLVSVSPDGISVVGTYRFHVTPDWASSGAHGAFPAWIELPIPVPSGEKIDEGLMKETKPELIYRGVTFKAENRFAKFSDLPIADGVKFMVVEFDLGEVPGSELEVTIRYTQPVIHRDKRLWAYYLPLITGYKTYEKILGLDPKSYAVSFEAHNGSSIRLTSEWSKVLQAGPSLISVEAHDREMLEVEIEPSHSTERVPPKRDGSS